MNQILSKELQEQIEREAEAEYQKSDYYKPLGQTMWIKAAVIAATHWAAKFQDSERRRNEANALLFPLLEYGQSKEANIPLGASITTVILQRANQFEQAKKALEEILDGATPYSDQEAWSWVYTCRQIVLEALASWQEEWKEGNPNE